VDVLYRTLIPTNRQIKTLMVEMANEADELCGTPMLNSVIGTYIDKVRRTKLLKGDKGWINEGQGLLLNRYNSMLNNGMLNKYKPQVKERVLRFLNTEM
jgi:hypothetical protein